MAEDDQNDSDAAGAVHPLKPRLIALGTAAGVTGNSPMGSPQFRVSGNCHSTLFHSLAQERDYRPSAGDGEHRSIIGQ